jgi:hypothetical protein
VIQYELSAAEEDAMDPGVTEEMNDRARAAMLVRTMVEGDTIRKAWLEFCDECQSVTAAQFIDGLREIGHDWWEAAVQQQWDDLYEACQ